MRRTIYVLLFCISLEMLASLGIFPQLAFASAHGINTRAGIAVVQKETYQQSKTLKHSSFVTGRSDKAYIETGYQQEKKLQHAAKRFWPSLNIPNFFSLWQQQPGKQKQKDVADFGE